VTTPGPGQPVPTCQPVPDNLPVATCPKALPPRARLPDRLPSARSPSTLHPVLRTTALVAWAALSGACSEQAADPVRAAQAFTARSSAAT
jgi:hypothetical protein